MTEQNNFVYEWTYDESQDAYLCAGQVFMLGVQVDEDTGRWVAIVWDNEPVDPRWDDEHQEIVLHSEHQTVHAAMDWCEAKDINEAEFDASSFTL